MDYTGWTDEQNAINHAKKHSAEMDLSEDEYVQLARIMAKMRRRRLANVRMKGDRATMAYDLDGFRLVTTPDDRVVSLYKRGEALRTSPTQDA